MITQRLSLRFDEAMCEKLMAVSDDGDIYSRLAKNAEDYKALHDELQDIFGIGFAMPEIDFGTNDAIVMFSDERSGSNTLDLMEVMQTNETIQASIKRTRGLTMDMAYTLIVIPVDKTTATKARGIIYEDPR